MYICGTKQYLFIGV